MMGNFFNHEENPLTTEEWEKLNATVVEEARRQLTGRRFIDVYGPLGPGVQAIAFDEFRGVSPGEIDLVGEADTATVFPDNRRFKPIPLIYKDFLIHWRDIEASRANNYPLDVSAAAGAATFCARKEDEIIFYGVEKLGFEGLMNATGREVLRLEPWDEAGSGFRNILRAVERLLSGHHYGPYALVLSPDRFAELHRIYEKTGTFEIDSIRKLVTDGVYQSSVLKADSALVVATGRGNLDLAVALDLSVAYLGSERMNHPFRVVEAVALRIKHPDAICTLEP
jgi:uncharacterized linocin/CFP29 family protein